MRWSDVESKEEISEFSRSIVARNSKDNFEVTLRKFR